MESIIVSPDVSGFEPQARVLYATAMARSLNYILKRDYLNHISVSVPANQDLDFSYHMETNYRESPIWLKIEQVGLPVKDTFKVCFDALQRILLFCAHQSQVMFLVTHSEDQYHMYLGIRSLLDGAVGPRSFVSFLKDFSQSLWNGLSCSQVSEKSASYKPIKDIISESARFEKIVALTGIPTSDLEQDDSYPLTIDNLLKSLRGKKVAYLVCADPMNPDEIDHSLFEIREAQGQMESIKTMSLQNSQGFSTTHSDCLSWSKTRSKKDFKKLEDDVLEFLGKKIGFKPASALVKAAKAGGAAGATALAGQAISAGNAAIGAGAAVTGSGLMGGIALAGLVSGVFVGSTSDQDGGNTTDAEGKSSNTSLGQSIVNKHAENVAKQLDVYSRRYEIGRATGMWNVGVYLLGEGKDVENAAYQLMAISSGKASIYEPMRKHDISCVTEHSHPFDLTNMPDIYAATKANRIFDNPFGKRNSELRTILTTRELTAYINFPLRAVDGINAVDTTPDFSLRPPKTTGAETELRIGKLLNGGTATGMNCTVDLRTLCKHSLICGINGSGKTNTVLNILTEVKRQGRPFLIIEPAKSEYVDWAFRHNLGKSPEEQIRILMPGKKTYAAPVGEGGTRIKTAIQEQLRINPFEVLDLGYGDPADSRNKTLAHIDLVKTMFGLAFPMQDILPTVLELMIYHLYETSDRSGKVRFPTLSSMLMTCEGNFIQNLGYDAKNTMIIRGALKTRVNSLLHGWKKELLNNPAMKGMTWTDLFSKPTVLNLSAVGDDGDKAFIMGLILMFLFEYWQSMSEKPDFTFSDNELNHLLVIEEAHRIMTANTNMDSPMYKVGRFFTNFLTEMRAYGQGLMIVDQVPGRLIPDAISNTNLKIAHKMVSGNDIEALAVSMGLSNEQKQMIPRLATGQCIISGVNSIQVGAMSDDDIYWCLMNKMK